ncbi:MAG: hypothetical protein F6K41_22440 [Symploca sp. SIO3E6]|nr:hypothetical protein [Caldora sp. SIO3E6]
MLRPTPLGRSVFIETGISSSGSIQELGYAIANPTYKIYYFPLNSCLLT